MTTIKLLKRVLVASVVTSALLTGANAAKKETKYVIATASTGGTYYPVGVGIATIASLKLAKKHKTTFSAITSAGSGENVSMLQNGEVNFAILQGLFGSMAWQGKAKYEGEAKKNLRSISMLWQNVEQFTIKNKFAKTGNIMDLTNGIGFDLAYDCVGGEYFINLVNAAKARGLIVNYGNLNNNASNIKTLPLLAKRIHIRFHSIFDTMRFQNQREEGIEWINKKMEEGILKPIISKVFNLENIVEAHKYLAEGNQLGKTVVVT